MALGDFGQLSEMTGSRGGNPLVKHSIGDHLWYQERRRFMKCAFVATAIAVFLFLAAVCAYYVVFERNFYAIGYFFMVFPVGLIVTLPLPLFIYLVGFRFWCAAVPALEVRGWSRVQILAFMSLVLALLPEVLFHFALGLWLFLTEAPYFFEPAQVIGIPLAAFVGAFIATHKLYILVE